jgi:hypothetical protein
VLLEVDCTQALTLPYSPPQPPLPRVCVRLV